MKKHLKAILIILLTTLICSPCFSKEKEQEGPTPLPPPLIQKVPSNEISTNLWAQNMKMKLPKELCQAQGFYLTCYAITEASCLQITESLVTTCTNVLAQTLPAKLDQQAASKAGSAVGYCASQLFQQTMAEKLKKTEDCQKAVQEKKG